MEITFHQMAAIGKRLVSQSFRILQYLDTELVNPFTIVSTLVGNGNVN